MIRVLCLKFILVTLIQNAVFIAGQTDDKLHISDKDIVRDGEAKDPEATSESGKQATDDYHRHIIEDGVKSALFGSNSYDPIKQVFEPPKKDPKPGEEGGGKVSNSSSTVLGDATTPPTTEAEGEKERKAFASASPTTSTNNSKPTDTSPTTPQITSIYTRQSVTTPGDIALADTTPTSSWWSRYKFRSDKINANQKLVGIAPNSLV